MVEVANSNKHTSLQSGKFKAIIKCFTTPPH